MLKTIAIDIGGSGGKAFVTDYDGKTLIVREIMRFANNPVYMATPIAGICPVWFTM